MGGWSSKPRKGMGTNLSVPNPLGFFPDHQLDPAFQANSENPDWDFAQDVHNCVAANAGVAASFRGGERLPLAYWGGGLMLLVC
uniref:Large S protein n=1 Tax=Hepatitis B virus TaxID=10407 RepID=D2X3P1_HBV|nr:large S protein [Hepatitis B virus]